MAGLVVLMGPTGAGKSVQAGLLVRESGWVHISSGELLRRDAHESQLMATGQLAPSAQVEHLVEAAIAEVPLETPVVLDGFPRMLDEAQWMESRMAAWGRDLERVVLLEVSDAVTRQRLQLRNRGDDAPEAIDKKMAEYHSQTQPVIDYYAAADKLVQVDGEGSVEEVHNRIKMVFNK
jgi:adenylate kinase